MDDDSIARRLTAQAGVISRAQVLAAGGRPCDIERMIRRRLWARVHLGVYVHHTGPLTWEQQAWAAVLLHEPSDDAAVAALANAVQRRRTTAARLLAELDRLGRLPRRAFLREVLGDVVDGAHSALERRYLRDVERAHDLPRGTRQLRAVTSRVAYRDVVYEGELVVVELDGLLGHDEQEERWDALDRDVDAAVTGLLPLRAGWRQVLDPCRLAMAVARILWARGWQGEPRRCAPSCPVVPRRDRGGSGAPDASRPPRSAA